MARVRLDRQVNLNLAGHVTAQVRLTESLALAGEVEDDRAGEFVVGHTSPVGSLEDVDAVPFAGALGAGGNPWRSEVLVFAVARSFARLKSGMYIPFFSRITPANPSSRSQKYTLPTPPS